MEITEMTLEDLEQMKNTLYSDFDNFSPATLISKQMTRTRFRTVFTIPEAIRQYRGRRVSHDAAQNTPNRDCRKS